MRARVIPEYRWGFLRACAGAEFVKSEFRPVPIGCEVEARENPFLLVEAEIHPIELIIPPAQPKVVLQTTVQPSKHAGGKR